MIELRQSTAGQEIPLGYFLDSTDGNTEEPGLTIANTDIKLWKWGATTLVNKNSGGATHISNAVYYCVLDATDTNTLGALIVFIHVTGALAVRVECAVLPANVWDSKYSTDILQVDVTQVSGDNQSALDLKDFVDNGYDPATNQVESVKLVDTCTDNTDMITVGEIADQVWDEAKSGHVGVGSFGEEVQDHALSSEISALNDLSAADVNAQVLDVLNTDTFAEPGQGNPPATTTLVGKIGYLYKFSRNKATNDGTDIKVYNDAESTVDHKSPVSESDGTVTRGKFVTGP